MAPHFSPKLLEPRNYHRTLQKTIAEQGGIKTTEPLHLCTHLTCQGEGSCSLKGGGPQKTHAGQSLQLDGGGAQCCSFHGNFSFKKHSTPHSERTPRPGTPSWPLHLKAMVNAQRGPQDSMIPNTSGLVGFEETLGGVR